MAKTIEAVYENGVLRPLRPIRGLKKNETVAITVERAVKKKHPLSGLCGILPDADAEEMLNAVKDEFEKVDVNEPVGRIERSEIRHLEANVEANATRR